MLWPGTQQGVPWAGAQETLKSAAHIPEKQGRPWRSGHTLRKRTAQRRNKPTAYRHPYTCSLYQLVVLVRFTTKDVKQHSAVYNHKNSSTRRETQAQRSFPFKAANLRSPRANLSTKADFQTWLNFPLSVLGLLEFPTPALGY